MDALFLALQVLFIVPALVRAAIMRGDSERTNIVAEFFATFRRPAVVVHGLGLSLLWIGVALALAFGDLPRSVTLRGALGAALLICSVLLHTWSVATLRSWRLLPNLGAGHELCTSGPYRLVRNPIYLAFDILAVGSTIWAGTATLAAAMVLLVLGGELRARTEEKVLLEAYGDRYREYMRRVRRTIPFLY